MRQKGLVLVLALFLLIFSLAACDGLTIETPGGDAGVTPVETAPQGDVSAVDSYPAPEEAPAEAADADADDAADEAADEVSGEVAQEAPLEGDEAPPAEAYPAPDSASQDETLQGALQEGIEAYPGPDDAPVDAAEAAVAEAYPAPVEAAEAYPAPADSQPDTEGEAQTVLPASLDGAQLANRVWTLQAFEQPGAAALMPAVDLPEFNTVEFFADGRVAIAAGCNLAQGDYSAVDGSINIQAANRTQDNCDAGSVGGQFLQWLNQVDGYEIQGDELYLTMPGESGRVLLHGAEFLSFGDLYTRMMAATAVHGLPSAKPETLDELMDASLDNLVYHQGDESALSIGEAPGAVVLVQSPSGSMAKADGLASVEDGKLMGANDRLEIGSNTMMFTAVLLAQLAEEGVLSLDDPLSTWLPQMAMAIPYGDEITLRHLATHTSGIPDYAELVIGAGAFDSEALRSAYTPEELVDIAIESFEPAFTPGESGQWQFSNTNYILLGMVLEAATGHSYADLLQQRIFEELDMTRSELLEGVPYPGSIVDGYFVYPYDTNTTEWNGTQGWAAGGIISTAGDMAKFARALMDGELFIDPATLDLMTDFFATPAGDEGTGYGLGLIEFGPGLWGHRGQTVGFTSIVAIDPANDFLMIALTNSAEGSVSSGQ